MDSNNNLIIAKGRIITADVLSCEQESKTGKWVITFRGGKEYSYSRQNVVWLKDPISINPRSVQIRYQRNVLNNIEVILSFRSINREYWHIFFSNGYEKSYDIRDLEIQRSCLENEKAKKVFRYLWQVAEETSVRTEDDTAILQKQYEKIDFLGDQTAVAVYLNPEQFATSSGLQVEAPIFPFGCNKSQYEAVTRALSNRISVIQGPPGTGKTQTILNLIANLIINGKTVQVVSNNNSAIENIIEKLESPGYRLGFFVASLGRTEKKQAFLQSQAREMPTIQGINTANYDSPRFSEEIKERSLVLGRIFEAKNKLANLKQEQTSIALEKAHFQLQNPVISDRLLLKQLSSSQLLQMRLECQRAFAKKPGLIARFLFRRHYGVQVKDVLCLDLRSVEMELQRRYYEARRQEITGEIRELEQQLQCCEAEKLVKEFTGQSLAYFKTKMAQRFLGKPRPFFFEDDLWRDPAKFLESYPVVLSTTYTARSSLGKNALFDYVIMDEASQVDVATGALALSCAKNAVIVGDTKQLSNIVTKEQKGKLEFLFKLAGISDAYNYSEHSFLDSIVTLFGARIPNTILREHYRCNPQIIGFCNQKFYQNDLIVMTEGADNAIKLMTTNAGKHEREHTNLRQAEVIRDEVLPILNCPKGEIGIITPYRNQVDLIRRITCDPEIEVETIHKYQGREKDVIIFSTVDDIIKDFSDQPDLLNVAVSRAKRQFILVASEEEQPQGSNVGDLIGYIRYHHCDVSRSKINSVFDYMYCQYEAKRLDYFKKHKRISEYDSENLMFGLIEDVLNSEFDGLGVVAHYPLYQLIYDDSKFTDEEVLFIKTGLSHIDFLIYNKVTKHPVLAIEVDGYWYHKEGTKQARRDAIKEHILEILGLPLIRFATNGSREKEKLSEKLTVIMKKH